MRFSWKWTQGPSAAIFTVAPFMDDRRIQAITQSPRLVSLRTCVAAEFPGLPRNAKLTGFLETSDALAASAIVGCNINANFPRNQRRGQREV